MNVPLTQNCIKMVLFVLGLCICDISQSVKVGEHRTGSKKDTVSDRKQFVLGQKLALVQVTTNLEVKVREALCSLWVK